MDLRNPRIALLKPWIRTSRDNPWISCAIHGSRCANFKFADNPCIALRKQLIAWFACRSSLRINYMSVSGVALASWQVYTSHVHGLRNHIQTYVGCDLPMSCAIRYICDQRLHYIHVYYTALEDFHNFLERNLILLPLLVSRSTKFR